MLEGETNIKEFQCYRTRSAALVAPIFKGVVFCCHQQDNWHSFLHGSYKPN